jgi:hypothetical protein
MNNQFTTVISYEKPAPGARHAGSVIVSSDFRALLKALGFMGLWLVLTVMLLAEPLMLNSRAAQAWQEPLMLSHEVAPALSHEVAPGTLPSPAATPHQLELRHAPTTVDAKLNAKPSHHNQHAQLSYAVLVK